MSRLPWFWKLENNNNDAKKGEIIILKLANGF